MLKKLASHDFSRLIPLVDALQCEKPLASVALSSPDRADVYLDEHSPGSLGILVYGHEALLLGNASQLDVYEIDQFLNKLDQASSRRSVSRIVCPSKQIAMLLESVPNRRFHLMERIMFRFAPSENDMINRSVMPVDSSYKISKIDPSLARDLFLAHSPAYYDFRESWGSPEFFCHSGVGHCVTYQGKPISIAFSVYPVTDQLEVGTATLPEHRRRGLGSLACRQLMLDCKNRAVEPFWSCFADNMASIRLANRLGFHPTGTYYWAIETPHPFARVLRKFRRAFTNHWLSHGS